MSDKLEWINRPIKAPPARLRQRPRAGGWRVWWEPETPLRELGFEPVELDAKRLTWSVREAERLNDLVEAARTGKGRRAPTGGGRGRDVKALITAYKASPAWSARRPATRTDYARAFVMIEDKWGSSLVVDFTKAIVYEWYETLYRTRGPFMARALIRKLSILMSHAELRGWREGNPCARLGMVTPPRRTRVADWDELDALLEAAKPWPSMACAIALAVFQGPRQTDIIAARTDGFAGARLGRPTVPPMKAVWRLRTSKRGKIMSADLHPEAIPYVKAALAAAGGRALLLHHERRDAPYTVDSFHDVWSRVRKAAAAAAEMPPLTTLKFRDLRRTFGHLSRLGGGDPRAIADALANKAFEDPELSAIYMPPTHETASRAVRAIRRPTKRPPKRPA